VWFSIINSPTNNKFPVVIKGLTVPDVILMFCQTSLLNRRDPIAIALLLSLGVSMSGGVRLANAVNFTVSIGDNLTYVDNATQSSGEHNSDVSNSLNVQFVAREVTGDYQASLDYSVEKVVHSEELFRDQLIVEGGSNIVVQLIPSRFNWEFSHSRSEVSSDSGEPDIPSNRTERQTLMTGPTLTFRFSERDFSDVSYRKSKITFENEGAAGSGRDQFQASYRHLLSPVRSVSVSASSTKVSFDGADQKFNLKNVFLGYSSQVRDGEFSINVGLNSVKSGSGLFSSRVENTGKFYEVEFSKRINSEHVVGVSASQDVTDSSTLGVDFQTGPEVQFDPLVLEALNSLQNIRVRDIVTVQGHDVSYQYSNNSNRWGVSALVSRTKNSSESGNATRRSQGYSVSIPYTISEKRLVSASLGFTKISVDEELEGTDETSLFGLNYSVILSPQLSCSAMYTRVLRRAQELDEKSRSNSVGAGFNYIF